MFHFHIKTINLVKKYGRYTACVSIGNKELDMLCKLRIWLQFKLNDLEVQLIEDCYELSRESLCAKTFLPPESHAIPMPLMSKIYKFVGPILREDKINNTDRYCNTVL